MEPTHPPTTPPIEHTASAAAPKRILPLLRPHEDPHCIECGFLLKGAAPAGTCPECGTAYDEVSSRELMQPPSVGGSLLYVGLPLIVGGVVLAWALGLGSVADSAPTYSGGNSYRTRTVPWMLIGSIGIGTIGVPLCLAWFGVRVFRLQGAIMKHAMPRNMAVRGGAQTLGCLGSAVASLAMAVGLIATVVGVLLSIACLIGTGG